MRDWLERLARGQPAVLSCERDAEMPNRSRLVRVLLVLVGIVAGFATIVPWLFGWLVILAAGGNEYHGIQDTGRPTSQHLLKFSDWIPGSGDLRPSHFRNLPTESVITEYRVGRAYGVLTKMVFYEAKYRLPDGSVRIDHAFGSEPLLSHRKGVLYGCLIGGPIFSYALFVLNYRLRSTSLRDEVHSTGMPSNKSIST